jgi:homoserine O-succinyltransferase
MRIGLVNNMPDAALARTEQQFTSVLKAAMPEHAVQVVFYSIPGVPRGELGKSHLASRAYRDIVELASADLDGLIVTGTEPKQSDLRAEPYWSALASLFDWIAQDGPSTIFSCLAAHAAVLHYDGIKRQRLLHKRFGLFDHRIAGRHPLISNMPSTAKIAHSRWNEVSRDAIASHGYEILTESAEAGVDLFVRQARNQLLFFQGHPEYDPGTLFREYRRDVQRFLAAQQNVYPSLPENYFSEAEVDLLFQFSARAVDERSESLMQEFPLATCNARWNEQPSPAAILYRAWLSQILVNTPAFVERRKTPRAVGMGR